jgi:hypothetical protein
VRQFPTCKRRPAAITDVRRRKNPKGFASLKKGISRHSERVKTRACQNRPLRLARIALQKWSGGLSKRKPREMLGSRLRLDPRTAATGRPACLVGAESEPFLSVIMPD